MYDSNKIEVHLTANNNDVCVSANKNNACVTVSKNEVCVTANNVVQRIRNIKDQIHHFCFINQ